MKGMPMKLVFAMIALGAPAFADTVCGSRDEVSRALSQTYGEQTRFTGLSDGGNLTELWVGRAGSWTVTMTTPEGVTCILAVGQAGTVRAAGVDG